MDGVLPQVNIDCGSDSDYTDDDEYGTKWVRDAGYTQSGTSVNITDDPIHDQVLDTLRVFPAGEKGCYSIPWDRQEQVLVRARFLYGNYDLKSSPPTFDLLLEGTQWDKVETFKDPSTYRSKEAIYVVKGGTVDVCVTQTADGPDPFMSSLQIRSISTDMYKDFNTDTAFIRNYRGFYGAGRGSVPDSHGRACLRDHVFLRSHSSPY